MAVFLIKKLYIHKFCYNNHNNNDYSITAKTYLRYAIFYNCSEIMIGNAKN